MEKRREYDLRGEGERRFVVVCVWRQGGSGGGRGVEGEGVVVGRECDQGDGREGGRAERQLEGAGSAGDGGVGWFLGGVGGRRVVRGRGGIWGLEVAAGGRVRGSGGGGGGWEVAGGGRFSGRYEGIVVWDRGGGRGGAVWHGGREGGYGGGAVGCGEQGVEQGVEGGGGRSRRGVVEVGGAAGWRGCG